MTKIRVFEDLLTLEVYSIGSHDAPNGFDIVESFEVNGKVFELTISGALSHHLENLRRDARQTYDREGFRSPEVMQEKWNTLDKELGYLRKSVASTLANLWHKQEFSTNDKPTH